MCAIISRRGSLGEFLAYMASVCASACALPRGQVSAFWVRDSLFDSEMSIACSGSVVRQTWSRVELALSPFWVPKLLQSGLPGVSTAPIIFLQPNGDGHIEPR